MTIYVLEAHNTGSDDDVRYREYTRSTIRAEMFKKIPRIDFTDSGHGIVFSAREHVGKRKQVVRELRAYVWDALSDLD